MEKESQTKIYLNGNEGIDSIIDSLKQHSAKEIVLVVPKDCLLLRDVESLKELKRKAEGLGKNISIVISDNSKDISIKSGNNVSTKIKVSVNSPLKKKREEAKSESRRKNNRIKMFDIIKKIEKTGSDVNYEDRKKEIFAKKIGDKDSDSSFEKKYERDELNKIYLHRNKTSSKSNEKEVIIVPCLVSKLLTVFIFICLVTAIISAAFILPKADIAIVLKTESATYDFEVEVDKFVDEVDILNNKIPARKIEVVNEKTGNYQTTGRKHVSKKASGEILVFNKYSYAPQRIISNTRFLSKEGKLFRIKGPIVIPGLSKKEGSYIPGQVSVMVYADKPGEEYNIEPTSFTLPGLQGSAKYSKIYAKSSKAMTGGINREVAYFSESDYIRAKEDLVKAVGKKNDEDFLNRISDSDILLERKNENEVVKLDKNIEISDIADNFQMTVSIETIGFLINKKDIDDFVAKKMSSKVTKDRNVIEGSIRYTVEDIRKDRNGKVIIPIHASQMSVAKIDVDKMKREISRKNDQELEKYFLNIDEIKSTNVSFWPFWVKSIPSSYDKINITVLAQD